MKHEPSTPELDALLRAALADPDAAPAPELDRQLKTALYQREAALRRPATRALPLWYLPMAANLLFSLLLAAAALLAIPNAHLALPAAGACLYLGLAGVLLTLLGLKRTRLKEDLTLRLAKRGTAL